MKALTICQPYAELILLGEKHVENRTWPTHYRGPLLIHAGKSRAWLKTYKPLPERMDFGAIVGVCELVDCVPRVEVSRRHDLFWLWGKRHVEGPYCWILKNVRRIERPVPYTGQQGLFEVPDLVVVEVG